MDGTHLLRAVREIQHHRPHDPIEKGGFANQLCKPDYIFVCMDTVSHPKVTCPKGKVIRAMREWHGSNRRFEARHPVISAQKEARKHGSTLVHLRRGSVSALERELIRVTAQA